MEYLGLCDYALTILLLSFVFGYFPFQLFPIGASKSQVCGEKWVDNIVHKNLQFFQMYIYTYCVFTSVSYKVVRKKIRVE